MRLSAHIMIIIVVLTLRLGATETGPVTPMGRWPSSAIFWQQSGYTLPKIAIGSKEEKRKEATIEEKKSPRMKR